jgi:hypothetical protein
VDLDEVLGVVRDQLAAAPTAHVAGLLDPRPDGVAGICRRLEARLALGVRAVASAAA